MTLLGLTLQQLALAFGAAGAGVTILYILKLRRRRVRVPFARLWDRVLKEKESTSLFSRLKRLLSLLLQLAFLLLLTAALGDPRLSSEVLDGRHIILLLDASGSMRAVDGGDDGQTRMDAAVERARELVRGMNGADNMMIVRMDAQVTPLSPFESDEKALLKVLGEVRPADTRADLRRALKFCGDALRGRDNPLLILVTDGAFPRDVLALARLGAESGERASGEAGAADEGAAAGPGNKGKASPGNKGKASPGNKGKASTGLDRVDLRGIPVRAVVVGRSADNLGIVAFNARRYVRNKLSFEVFLEVVNRRKQAAEADLQLLSDGAVIEVQRLTLQAGERARYTCDPDEDNRKQRAWCNLAADGELLEAQLVAPGATDEDPRALDAFPLDDRAFALLPRRRKQKVMLVSKGNLFLEGALLLDPNIEVTKVKPDAFSAAAARRHHAIIYDGLFPTEHPEGKHYIVFNPPREDGPFKVTGVLKGPLITDQDDKHPVIRWLTFKDVNIGESAVFARGEGVQVLVSSIKNPLIVARTRGGTRSVAVGFDIKRSDMPMRVAFPLLVLNSLDWFAGDSEGLVTSYRTGQTWSVPVQGIEGAGRLEMVDVVLPGGRRVQAPVHDGRVLLYGSRVGVYELQVADERVRLAANLADPVESSIRPAGEALVLGGRTLAAPTGFGVSLRREIWIYLVLAALGLTLLEWLTYNRRITV